MTPILFLSFAATGPGDASETFGAWIMYAFAAFTAGGFFGFLFGIPKSSTATGDGPADTRTGRFSNNTNIEQVSDWLTKLLIGATLTQIGELKQQMGRMVDTMARATGEKSGGAALAGAIVVYFAAIGFFITWLWTSLRLSGALSASQVAAEKLLKEAAEAENTGESDLAKKLRSAAEIVQYEGSSWTPRSKTENREEEEREPKKQG